MLGSKVLSVRLSGIYVLARLAEEDPNNHIEVMQSLCAFVRHPPPLEMEENARYEENTPTNSRPEPYRVDVRAAVQAIGTRNDMRIALEQKAEYKLDLNGSDLRNQNLSNMNLSKARLEGANLSGALLYKTNLSDAHLFEAVLQRAKLRATILVGANLLSAIMSDIEQSTGADFSDAHLSNANRLYLAGDSTARRV